MYLTYKKLEKSSTLLILFSFLAKVIQTPLQKFELLFQISESDNSQMCNNHTLKAPMPALNTTVVAFQLTRLKP